MGRALKSRWVVATAAFIVGVSIAGGVSWATIPDSSTGAISACYPTSGTNKGSLRVINYQAGERCAAGQAALSWPTRTFCGGYPHIGIDWSMPGSTPGNGCNLSGANLGNANLSKANLTDANFSNANLQNSALSNAIVSGVNFTSTLLGGNLASQHTNLSAVVGLTNAQIRSIRKLSITLCNGMTFSGPNLAQAILTGLNFNGFDLHQVMLASANMSGDALKGVNFTQANLAGANLSNADLTNANLTCARLDAATLTGAILTGVTWGDTTCPDGTNSNNDGNTCLGHL